MRIFGLDIVKYSRIEKNYVKTFKETMEDLETISGKMKDITSLLRENQNNIQKLIHDIPVESMNEWFIDINNNCLLISRNGIELHGLGLTTHQLIKTLCDNPCIHGSTFLSLVGTTESLLKIIEPIIGRDLMVMFNKITKLNKEYIKSTSSEDEYSDYEVDKKFIFGIINDIERLGTSIDSIIMRVSCLITTMTVDLKLSKEDEHEIIKSIRRREANKLPPKGKIFSVSIFRQPDAELTPQEQEIIDMIEKDFKSEQLNHNKKERRKK